MPRSIRSARIAIIATLITSSYWLVASAAETDNPAQTKAAPPAPGDACSLLTKQDAAAALGEAVSGPNALADLPAGQGATLSSELRRSGDATEAIKGVMKSALDRLR